MHRLFCFFFAFAALASCTTTRVPDGEIVPMQKIVADIRERPYECFEYDARKDSCAAIARRSVRGNVLTMDVQVREFVSGVGNLTMNMGIDFQIRENTYCGDFSKADVDVTGGVIPSDIKEAAIASAKRGMARRGVVCSGYMRDGTGQYYSVSYDRSGRVTGTADRVWFFAGPKTLSN